MKIKLNYLLQISNRLNTIGAHSAPARASAILAGLQFTPEQQKTPTKYLSGGWRMRVSLACALFIKPDILMLDEPTNHLDLHAVIWLQVFFFLFLFIPLLNTIIKDLLFFIPIQGISGWKGTAAQLIMRGQMEQAQYFNKDLAKKLGKSGLLTFYFNTTEVGLFLLLLIIIKAENNYDYAQ